MGPTPAWLKNNPPVTIAYADKGGNKTVRDITPLRINGSPEYDFGINAYCHLRKDNRDFWVSKISSAWLQGREINLGDHLAELCMKTKEYKSAAKKTSRKRSKE
jgi:predicted DNA-binding transcriptional regulator YafY